MAITPLETAMLTSFGLNGFAGKTKEGASAVRSLISKGLIYEDEESAQLSVSGLRLLLKMGVQVPPQWVVGEESDYYHR